MIRLESESRVLAYPLIRQDRFQNPIGLAAIDIRIQDVQCSTVRILQQGDDRRVVGMFALAAQAGIARSDKSASLAEMFDEGSLTIPSIFPEHEIFLQKEAVVRIDGLVLLLGVEGGRALGFPHEHQRVIVF